MIKYYTRACNFYFGSKSVEKIKKKLSLPLNGNRYLSFDSIEIINRKKIKTIHIKDIIKQKKLIKKKIFHDLKTIIKKIKFKGLKFHNTPIFMGIINITPDSFSDGGKFNSRKRGLKQAQLLIKNGCKIIDIGGESTRPGSKAVPYSIEWRRVNKILKFRNKLNCLISLDTRKTQIMKNFTKNKINIINDISGFGFDSDTLNFLKKSKIPFIINHIQGNPENMQKNPKYKNVLLEIYDYFEEQIKKIRSIGINHNNIILDPGIGFGKNLKHNITLISNISIFHSLGFPIMLGASRKRFIVQLSGANNSNERLGGTISTNLYAMMQGVQILRVHDVNELNQSVKVFKSFY